MDLLLAPVPVVDALISLMQRSEQEQADRERRDRLRARLRSGMK